MELLSPAGSLDAAFAAFKAGADAVYLGLKNFSARKKAYNFSNEELVTLLKYSKKNSKKVYLTMNTIIEDDEFEEAVNTALTFHNIGIDGIILQDIGFASVLMKIEPEIILHASTQMAIYNLEGVLEAEKIGIKRVVLARELSFEEIKRIKENSNIELEVFIHGALCYSFSGLCLASGILTGRSGNRGECAQICRNHYKTEDKKGFFFSCKDLSLEKEILKLKEIGIKSLKIEGRMKKAQYVFHTTKMYRNIIDGKEYDNEKISSQINFSRGNTKFFFSNEDEKITENFYPAHKGVFAGKAVNVREDSFEIRMPEIKIENEDTLLFFRKNDALLPLRIKIKSVIENKDTIIIKSDKLPEENADIFLIDKNIRNNFFKDTEHEHESDISFFKIYKHKIAPVSGLCMYEIFKDRENLNPSPSSLIPFTNLNKIKPNDLVQIDKFKIITLNPILFNFNIFIEAIKNLLTQNKSVSLLIGVSNISHLKITKELANFENCYFFIDFSLYIGNSKTYEFFREKLGDKLIFSYGWIESKKKLLENYASIIYPDNNFSPPFFISRINFFKEIYGENNSSTTIAISNKYDDFILEKDSSLTYLFKKL